MLAIVIPYYKLKFFKKTLDSLECQTNKNFKVFIGDDCSPDKCDELLDHYIAKFSFKYFRFDLNLGNKNLTSHWERCIDLVDEDIFNWIMLLCDDDVLGSNVVHEFYQQLPNFMGKSSVVRFATHKIDGEDNIISDSYLHPQFETTTEFIKRKYSTVTRSSLSEYVFDFSSIRKIKFRNLPLAWYSDLIAVIEVSNKNSIYTVNNCIVKIRYSTINISGNTSSLFDRKKLIAQRQFCYFLIDNINIFSETTFIRKIILKYLRWDKTNIKLLLKYFRMLCYEKR